MRLLGLLVVACGTLFAPGVTADPALVLGVLPRDNYAETISTFTPIARQLAQALGREVRLETAKDFPSFWHGVRAQRYDIAHYNQYHYLKSHREHAYHIVAKNEEAGSARIAAVIMVRKDSGIQSLAQLRGRKLVFGGDSTAMMSYIVPTALLRDAGLKPGDYLEEFARNPPNAVMAVYYGQAAACGVGDPAPRLAGRAGPIDAGQLRVLATSEPLPHLAWAVRADLPAALRERIRQALTTLAANEPGRQALARAGLSGVVAADDAEYDAHRRIVERVLHERL
jgi:phosphonate transport system substrate-binding protein